MKKLQGKAILSATGEASRLGTYDERAKELEIRARIIWLTCIYAAFALWSVGVSVWLIIFIVPSVYYVMDSKYPHPFDKSTLPDPSVTADTEEAEATRSAGKRNAVLTQDTLDEIDRKVGKGAALAEDEATVMTLFRFRRELGKAADCTFDEDLAAEVEVLAADHFVGLIDDYVRSRETAIGATATNADRSLSESVLRLTTRLLEIKRTQSDRHASNLETKGNFLRGRHPVAGDDPFAKPD